MLDCRQVVSVYQLWQLWHHANLAQHLTQSQQLPLTPRRTRLALLRERETALVFGDPADFHAVEKNDAAVERLSVAIVRCKVEVAIRLEIGQRSSIFVRLHLIFIVVVLFR